MRKRAVAVLLATAACSSHPRLPRTPEGPVVVEIGGEVKGGPFRIGRADVEKLPRRAVHGREPATGRAAWWEGLAIAPLVSERVELTHGADTVVVRTADGRAVPIPLIVVRQARPVLADHADGTPIADALLAWPNLEQRGWQSDPRAASWWAWDVQRLDLVNGYATLGRALRVPDGAPAAARLGASLFGARCIECHRLRKFGGTKGPDLTRVADRLSREALERMMPQHTGFVGPDGEAPVDGAAQLWAFLRAVAADAAAGGDVGPEDKDKDKDREQEGRGHAGPRGP